MTTITDRLAALRKPSMRTVYVRSDYAVSPDFQALLDNWCACGDRLSLAVELLLGAYRDGHHVDCAASWRKDLNAECDCGYDAARAFLAHIDKERSP